MSTNPPEKSPEKVAATPRHWLWTLASVLAFVAILLVALVYFLICWPLSALSKHMERRLSVSRR